MIILFSIPPRRGWMHMCVLVCMAAFLCVVSRPALSQISTRIGSVTSSPATVNAPVTITVALLQGETIEKVYIAYRPFGTNEYTRLEMDIVGNSATVTLPAQDILPPFVEYYIVLQHRTGFLESYPLSETYDPFVNPPGRTLQLLVGSAASANNEVLFLSPDPGGRVQRDDLLISISLFRADTAVVKRATQVLLDGVDISGHAVLTDDILIVSPENAGLTLRNGIHRLTVRLYNREGRLHRTASMQFSLYDGEQLSAEPGAVIKTNASVQLESRNENVSSVSTWYNRATVSAGAQSGDWRLSGNAFITSDEKPDRQPQNRFFIGMESSWLRVGYGDAYPTFPNLVLAGKRVRGLVSALKLGWFNVDMTLGKTSRAIDGSLLRTFSADSFAVEYTRDSLAGNTPAYGRIDSATWGKYSYGTFARDLFAIRPSFGSGEEFQLGLTWLKSKDDVTSIRYGVRPQENVVVGSDFVARFDDRRIELAGQGAFSAYNADISGGTFTDANIDSLFKEDTQRKDARTVRDILSRFITVNENLRPLSFKKPATLAYDASLALNYFDNYLKVAYLFRGSDYNSFGQTFLRKDIHGFNIADRIRLMGNQLLGTGSVEFLKDNTSDQKAATTSFANLNFSVSYFPAPGLPNGTIGFSRYTSKNDLATIGVDTLTAMSAIDDATNRFFLQSSYDFEMSAHHTASFNLSTSNRADNSIRHYDVKNLTVAFGLSTKYAIPLQTSLDVSINTNTLPSAALPGGSSSFDYTSVGVTARYTLVQNTLSVSAAANPSFGDFQRTAWDIMAEWIILPAMALDLQFSLYNNHNLSSDTIWSMRYRYDI
jgi:hypothetical protein